jgi:hypothetical protein
LLLSSFFSRLPPQELPLATPDGDADEALSSAAEENVNEILRT